MSFFNKVWRVGVLGIVAVGFMTAACADDNGALLPGGQVTVTGSISGTVTIKGGTTPVVGALVGTSPATSTALTDAQGRYSITNIPIPATGSASFAVTASKANLETGAEGTATVALTAASPNATANLQLTEPAGPAPGPTTGTLNVLVTDRNGVAQSGAAVVAKRSGAADSLTGNTDANGFVVFANATPGAYTVRASKTISGIPFRASGGVNVVAGQTAFLQLTLGRDFGQSVFPNFRGAQATPVDIDFVAVPGARDNNPDVDCNIIRTQHMFIAQVVDAAGNRVSGVKVDWSLNTSENGTISIRCPQILDDPAGCAISTVPGNTGSIVDTDDPDLNPFTARTGLDPAFRLDTRTAVTFTNDQSGAGNSVSFAGRTVTVGEGQTWIIITSPVEGVTDVIVSSSDIRGNPADCGLDEDPDTLCDKDFAIKRWVNWQTGVFELIWPNNPGPTRDPFDDEDAEFTEIANGSTFTNVLSRGVDADCDRETGICTLTLDEHLFISTVERLRADSPFNMSKGFMVWDVTDDNPDVDFWGEDAGNATDGCTNGVCNAEHNGPTDDRYTVRLSDRNHAEIEFDANNTISQGGVITQNLLCTAPCDEDDFIGWGIVEVRLDPAKFFCTDEDGDGDCNPGEPGGDTFSAAYLALVNGTGDNTAAFRVRFVDEFGEVCGELTFKKKFVTSRLTIIKNTVPPNTWSREEVDGQSVKTHTILVGETFSYTITAINDGEVRAQNVRITDTLPRFGTQFEDPDDGVGVRDGSQSFQYLTDRPSFDPQAVVYGIDEDDDDDGDVVDSCIIGRQAGNDNAAAYVPPAQCLGIEDEVGTVAVARAAAVSASGNGDQVVFIQYYDEEILSRQEPGGGIQSEDSVEITLKATASIYSGVDLPVTTCNIATVTDGPGNLGDLEEQTPPVSQSFAADTLCHEVREALLQIRKTTTDAVITAGDSARFSVEVSNLGTANLTNVVISDTVDAALFLAPRTLQAGDIRLNATNCVGCTVTITGDFTFSVTIPTLTPGGFRTVFTMVIPSTTIPGTFCNRVTAVATRPSGTIRVADIACINVRPGAIELDLTNDDGFRDAGGVFQSAKEIFHIGEGGTGQENLFVFRVTVTNRSSVFSATNVRIVDLVAPVSGRFLCRAIFTGFPTRGTTAPAAPACNTTGFTWNIGTLGPGAAAEIQFRVEAVLTGDDLNRATLTADQLSGPRISEEPATVVQ